VNQKVWTSRADADWCFSHAPSEAPKLGLSLLLVGEGASITVRPLRQMTDDADSAGDLRGRARAGHEPLGTPGAGWGIAMGIVAHERGPMWTFVFQRRSAAPYPAVEMARTPPAPALDVRWSASASHRRTSRWRSCG
jgi:hypothetical protein